MARPRTSYVTTGYPANDARAVQLAASASKPTCERAFDKGTHADPPFARVVLATSGGKTVSEWIAPGVVAAALDAQGEPPEPDTDGDTAEESGLIEPPETAAVPVPRPAKDKIVVKSVAGDSPKPKADPTAGLPASTWAARNGTVLVVGARARALSGREGTVEARSANGEVIMRHDLTNGRVNHPAKALDAILDPDGSVVIAEVLRPARGRRVSA